MTTEAEITFTVRDAAGTIVGARIPADQLEDLLTQTPGATFEADSRPAAGQGGAMTAVLLHPRIFRCDLRWPVMYALAVFSDGKAQAVAYHPDARNVDEVTLKRWDSRPARYNVRRAPIGWQALHAPSAARIAAVQAVLEDVYEAARIPAVAAFEEAEAENERREALRRDYHRKTAAGPALYDALKRWEQFARDNLWTEQDLDFLAATRAALALAENSARERWACKLEDETHEGEVFAASAEQAAATYAFERSHTDRRGQAIRQPLPSEVSVRPNPYAAR